MRNVLMLLLAACAPDGAGILAPGAFEQWLIGPVTTIDDGEGAKGDHFGEAVAMSGTVVIVGAPDDSYWNGTGTAIALGETGTAASPDWQPHGTFVPADGGPGDRFGASVAI